MSVVRQALALALLGAATLAVPAGAAEPVRLTVAQAAGAPPDLTVFLDLVDEGGTPPATLDAAAITATVGGTRAAVAGVTPFASTGEGVAYIFMVDVSQSMAAADLARVREAIHAWLATASAKDRFALVTFGDEVTTAADFTADRSAVEAAAASLAPVARTTRLHSALERAIELSRRQDEGLPARRVAVLLSDGQDEGSGLAADDVAAMLRQERLAVFAIGYSRLRGAARTRGLDALNRFARNSGGQFAEAAPGQLPALYAAMQRAITRVFAVAVRCEACPADGQLHRLDVEVKTGARVLSDGLDVRLAPAAARGKQAPDEDRERAARIARAAELQARRSARMWWSAGAAGVVVALAALGFVVLGRRRRAAAAQQAAADPSVSAAPADAVVEPDSADRDRGIAVTCHFRGRRAPAPLTVTLRDRLTLGSDPACAIVIPDDGEVAPSHCELGLEQGRVTLRRLDATLPTLVNGAALAATSRYRLESGDVLLVGRTELRLMFGEEAV